MSFHVTKDELRTWYRWDLIFTSDMKLFSTEDLFAQIKKEVNRQIEEDKKSYELLRRQGK